MCFTREKLCTWKSKHWANSHMGTRAASWACPELRATTCVAAAGVGGGIWHMGTVLCSPVCLGPLMCWSRISRSWTSVTTTELNLWWCFLSRLTDGNEYLFQAKDDVSVFFLRFYYCAVCAVVPWAEAAANSWCALYVWVISRPRAAQVQPLGGVSGGAQPEGMSWGCFSLHIYLCPFPLHTVAGVRRICWL